MNEERKQLRAKATARMGMVEQNGENWVVFAPYLRGSQAKYTVTKNACTCLDFEDNNTGSYQCEHMLAVNYWLIQERAAQQGGL